MQLKISKYFSLFLTVSLLTAGFIPETTFADAGFRPLLNDYGNLVNQGKCVDTRGSRVANDTPLILWDCNGSKSQQWSYDERTLSLRNRTGKCISVEDNNNRNGTRLVLANCNAGKSQQWEHQGHRNSDNVRGLGGKCMATEEDSNGNGTYLILSTCDNQVYQQFWGQELETTPTDKVTTQGEVCLYELADYKGWKKCFSRDLPDFVKLGIDDSVSSLTIHGHLKVKLYEEDNYQGEVHVYTEDTPWVGNEANNKFSSLKIERRNEHHRDDEHKKWHHPPSTSDRDDDRGNEHKKWHLPLPGRDKDDERSNSPDDYTDRKPIFDKDRDYQRPSQEFFKLTNRQKKCLEVQRSDFDSLLNGGKVQVWECNNTINQDWTLDNYSRLTTRNGKCLAVDTNQPNQNGARVQSWDCHNHPTQQWYMDQGRLRHRDSGRCLDIDSQTMDRNGGKVQLWDCHERANQQWVMTYHQPGENAAVSKPSEPPWKDSDNPRKIQEFFRLVSRGRCLDVHRSDFDSRRQGGKVQIWDCNNEVNQAWKFDSRGHLTSRNGQCLDIAPNAMNQNGTLVQLLNCQDRPSQQWFLENNRIHNRGLDKCLDLDSGSMDKNGGKAQVWDCHDRANQKWEVKYH